MPPPFSNFPVRKLIVITGTSRGLGRALVSGFSALGHTVAGCGRDASRMAALTEDLPAPHSFTVVDVTNHQQVAEWAARIVGKFGPPDVLINNAAVVNTPELLWKVPAAELDILIDTNIKGVANVIRHFVPAMVAASKGLIVNLSSGWGRSTSPNFAPYCASKWAIEGMTQALAQELPLSMAAVAMNPGIINTDMLRRSFGTGAKAYESPEEWARHAVPFILSLGPKNNGKPVSVP